MILTASNYNKLSRLAYNTPNLDPQEEKSLLIACKDGCKASANKLVMSHLKLVISLARECSGYNLIEEDLVQVGIIGLLKSIKSYDITYTSRLCTYAIYSIKSEIYNYVIDNWSIVKVATTKAQRKLFFNLRSKTNSALSNLNSDEIDRVSKELDVSKSDVVEMSIRLSNRISIDSDNELYPITSTILTPDQEYELNCNNTSINNVLNTLDSRSKYIIEQRFLVDDIKNRETLATELNVSQQRIDQIEKAALKKLKLNIS